MKPKALALFVAVMLYASVAWGQLAITVRSFPPGQELKPGVAVVLTVKGLEPGEEPIWHHNDIEGDMVLPASPTFRLFGGTEPGPRTFIVQVPSEGADPFAVCTFQYGGKGGDDVNPPPPPPPGEIAVVVVREKADQLAPQGRLMNELLRYLLAEEIPYRCPDEDQVRAKSTEQPAYLLKALTAAKAANVPLPFVVVCSADFGSVVYVEPLPKTFAETKALIERYANAGGF